MPPPDQAQPQDIEVEVRPKRAPQYAAIVSLHGEHDLATSATVVETLRPLLGNVLVDLSDCAFLDSTVIGALITAARELDREGYTLSLVVPPENASVARTLEIVRIGELIEIHARVPSGDGMGREDGE